MEFQAVRMVNNAVENTVGHGDIPDLFVPVSQGQLRSQDQGTPLITVITDFQKVPPLAVFERSHREIIQH
jgi:hypothetical protein